MYILVLVVSKNQLASFISTVFILQGLGQVCGRNVLTQHCSPLAHRGTVLRMLEGVAREGNWAVLSDVETLSVSSLSVLSQMVQLISTSLQAKRDAFTLAPAKQVLHQVMDRKCEEKYDVAVLVFLITMLHYNIHSVGEHLSWSGCVSNEQPGSSSMDSTHFLVSSPSHLLIPCAGPHHCGAGSLHRPRAQGPQGSS